MSTVYFSEMYYDLKSLLRTPSFFIPSLAFPLVFYIFFGIILHFSQGHPGYLLVGYGCFGVIAPALFNFSVYVATDRAKGWLTLKRLSPMPMTAYLCAKLLSSLVFAAVIWALLLLLATTAGNVSLSVSQYLLITVILLLGVVPFALLGLLLGLTFAERSTPAIANLIYLPSAFFGGLWIPIMLFPEALQNVALWLPTFHFAQLAFAVIGADEGIAWYWHVGYLLVFSLVMTAAIRWRWQTL